MAEKYKSSIQAGMKNVKADTKFYVNKVIDSLRKGSKTQQLLLGTAAGWTSGCLTMRVGRTAAIGIGSGILLMQLAQNQGYIKMNWNDMQKKAEQSTEKLGYNGIPRLFNKAKTFARTNTCFAAGFIGGFLIGLAT